MAGKSTVTEAEFHLTVGVLRNAYDSLFANLRAADHLRLPQLKNMKPDEPLGPFLLSQPPIRPLSDNENALDGNWINLFLGQMGEVLDKIQRILRKSLGGILALQERIAERWAALRRDPLLSVVQEDTANAERPMSGSSSGPANVDALQGGPDILL